MSAEWHAKMLAQIRAHFPWTAKASDGRWFLVNARGDSLARFNLDSGHACRMAAAAPDLFDAIANSDDAHWTPAMRAAMAKAVGDPRLSSAERQTEGERCG